MTEENQDDALKQLSQSNEADDRPVEGETSSPDKPQENSQLASGMLNHLLVITTFLSV